MQAEQGRAPLSVCRCASPCSIEAACSTASPCASAVSGPASGGPPGGRFQWGSFPEQKSCSSRRPALCSSGRAICTTQPLARATARSSSAAVGALHAPLGAGTAVEHLRFGICGCRTDHGRTSSTSLTQLLQQGIWCSTAPMRPHPLKQPRACMRNAAHRGRQLQGCFPLMRDLPQYRMAWTPGGAAPVRVILWGVRKLDVVGGLQLLSGHQGRDHSCRGPHLRQPVDGDDACMAPDPQPTGPHAHMP